MKKIFFALVACVAMLSFTACNETVESQIFDLSYDGSATEQANRMAYELTYQPMIVAALSKVAKPATESGTTFTINSTEKKAKLAMQEAFEAATQAAQKAAGEPSLVKDIKVILEHSTTTNQKKTEVASYTFK